ncbi:diacylglycerol acyltransferase [Hesseltinella vesiculosa]|uniref:Diacylglycerol O-acyltransferase n=1 Tax=Hesseltinella vesiculosa TaxID=101127 RepID=A0A1X2GTG4_9FUNG|nr:diacylglycerol acyltransferase [Hesseltinella vesiculosa]
MDTNYSLKAAPLSIPFERRFQMFSTIIWVSMIMASTSAFFVFCTQIQLWPIVIAYMTYMLMDTAPDTGGRRRDWVRQWPIWRGLAGYFPIHIIKETTLDPEGNYLFGYHPHGILSFGAMSIFTTEGSDWSQHFPGITPHLMTLSSNFKIPIYRDLLLSLGFCSVSRSSCEYILGSGPGQSIAIAVGGAQEALTSLPGTNNIIVEKRLGFIRLAIRKQVSLVPVFCFGETDLFKQCILKNGSILANIQALVKKHLGFAAPLFYARGIFNYDIGLLPYRKPVTCVIGRPIKVPSLEHGQTEATPEQVALTQTTYIQALKELYDNYKDIYAKDRVQELQIIA